MCVLNVSTSGYPRHSICSSAGHGCLWGDERSSNTHIWMNSYTHTRTKLSCTHICTNTHKESPILLNTDWSNVEMHHQGNSVSKSQTFYFHFHFLPTENVVLQNVMTTAKTLSLMWIKMWNMVVEWLPWPTPERERGHRETSLQTIHILSLMTLRRGSHVKQNLIFTITKCSKPSLENTEDTVSLASEVKQCVGLHSRS